MSAVVMSQTKGIFRWDNYVLVSAEVELQACGDSGVDTKTRVLPTYAVIWISQYK